MLNDTQISDFLDAYEPLVVTNADGKTFISKSDMLECLKNEYILNESHLCVILYTKCFRLNAHAKVEFKNIVPQHEQIDGRHVIFVPNSASTLLHLVDKIDKSANIILDLRGYEKGGSAAISLFAPFLQSFCINIKDGKYTKNCKYQKVHQNNSIRLIDYSCDKLYMNVVYPYISQSEIKSSIRGRFSKSNVTVIMDRKTFKERDMYNAMLIAYFCCNFKVIGELPASHNAVFMEYEVSGIVFNMAHFLLDHSNY